MGWGVPEHGHLAVDVVFESAHGGPDHLDRLLFPGLQVRPSTVAGEARRKEFKEPAADVLIEPLHHQADPLVSPFSRVVRFEVGVDQVVDKREQDRLELGQEPELGQLRGRSLGRRARRGGGGDGRRVRNGL